MAHFFGNGFFGGAGGDDFPGGSQKEEIDNKALYETLGVPINATEAEIRKAYKKLARENHPDRGGDTEKFKEISLAYEVIGDKDKRELYDRYGLEGIKNGGGGGAGGMSDLFEMFGMGGGGRRQQQRKKKVKPTVKEVTVTLEDVYTGKMLKIKNRKTCLCEECHGKGGEGVKKCSDCNGQGMVVKMRMLGPNMYTQSQEPCRECKGQGEIIDPKKVCKACKGEKIKTLNKEVDVAIEVGCPDEHVVQMEGQGNEVPGAEAGDLVVKINIAKHKSFRREGADLWMEKAITLKESLLGFTFKVRHLDGKDILISSTKGEIISPGVVKTIKHKGMPFYNDTISTGNLFIKFNITFPKSKELNGEAREILNKLLPGPATQVAAAGTDCEYLEDFNQTDTNPNPEGGHQRQDEDEDHEHDPRYQRAECPMQ